MGSLATWGAIGGAAKGVQMNVERKQAQDDRFDEEAREKRLIQLREEIATRSQEREFEHSDKSQNTNITAQREMLDTEITGRADEAQKGRDFTTDVEQPFTAGENQADRESNERRTQTTAEASGSRASKRFTPKTITETKMGARGLPEESDKIALFDNQTGRTFIQTGDVFVPQGTAPPEERMRASRKAVDVLMRSPELADQFLNEYKYLPIEFYQATAAQDGISSRRTVDSARGVGAMEKVGSGGSRRSAP